MELHNITFLTMFIAIGLLGVISHLWVTKRIISYKTARLLVLMLVLLSSIPDFMRVDWVFATGVTLFQIVMFYFILKIINKRIEAKRLEENSQKDNEPQKDRVL